MSTTPLLSSSSSTTPTDRRLPPPLPNRSFIYPLYGISYLLTHSSLYPFLQSRIVPLFIVSVTTITLLFTFLYIPHVAILAFFHGPFAFQYAAVMILTESAAVVSILAESFLTEAQIIDVFDTVLLERTAGRHQVQDLVAKARVLDRDAITGEWKLGEHRSYPFLKFKESFNSSILFILELPLNLIPVIGTPLFVCLQGYHLGPLHHYHYFQLLRYDAATRKEYVRQNRFKYSLFGLVHVLLQMIPVANIFFLFSTGTGAALWASKAELRRLEGEGNHDATR